MNKKVTTLAMSFALCLLTTVCVAQDDSWQHAMHGKWKCDVEKTIELMKEAEVPETSLEMMKEMLPGMSFEFGEGTMGMKMDAAGFKDEKKGTCKVTEADEEKKWLKLEVVMDGDESIKTGEITFLEDDAMQLKMDDDSVVVLSRVKEEESDD